jgi:hypothetical protein
MNHKSKKTEYFLFLVFRSVSQANTFNVNARPLCDINRNNSCIKGQSERESCWTRNAERENRLNWAKLLIIAADKELQAGLTHNKTFYTVGHAAGYELPQPSKINLTIVTDRNEVHDEIRRINSFNACYCPVRKQLSSHQLYRSGYAKVLIWHSFCIGVKRDFLL